jgi:undecaprenyl-diphosphatase
LVGLKLVEPSRAFLSALLVVKLFIGIVQRMGFAPFAWYRILVGLGLVVLFWPR